MATYLRQHGEGDRMSALPDEVLHGVLSHLPSDEATRATALSRQWRRICEGVPVVDLVDRGTDREGLPVCFHTKVTGAILSKGPSPTRPSACSGCTRATRRTTCSTAGSSPPPPPAPRRSTSRCGAAGTTTTTCSTARSARSPPGSRRRRHAAPPAPHQLDPRPALGCPRRRVARDTEITVSSDRLRSFAMVCCHNARRVVLRIHLLRSLRYKGGLPSDTFLDVPDYGEVAPLTIDICEDLTTKAPMEVAPVLELISWCKKLAYLHLALRPSMAYYSREITAIARDHLPELRHLVLKGFLSADHVVRAVAVLVASTLHLKALSLLPLGSKPWKKKTYRYNSDDVYGSDTNDRDPEPEICDDDIYDDEWMLRSMWRWGIPCTHHSLLSNGAALEEFSVTLASPLWERSNGVQILAT